MNKRPFILATLLVSLCLSYSPALADDDGDKHAKDDDDKETSAYVEVTATRIPEDTMKEPSAISVVTGDELRARGATDLGSALSLLAGIDIAPGNDNGPSSAVPEIWGLREFDAFLLV